jgi:CheY-like chemotaxis protein
MTLVFFVSRKFFQKKCTNDVFFGVQEAFIMNASFQFCLRGGIRMLISDRKDVPEGGISGVVIDLMGRRVVIVDDQGMIQMHLALALKRSGMVVVGTAANEPQAVTVVLRERPDIVIMDIHLTEGDGLAAVQRILVVYRPCIVILTAYSDEKHIEQARQLGIDSYVIKPITTEILIQRLRTAYQVHQSSTADMPPDNLNSEDTPNSP